MVKHTNNCILVLKHAEQESMVVAYGCERLAQGLREQGGVTQILDWRVDVSTHAAQLNQHLCSRFLGCPQLPAAKPRKPSLSSDTWHLIQEKKACRKSLAKFRALRLQIEDAIEADAIPASGLYDLLSDIDIKLEQTAGELKDIGRAVVRAVRRDDVQYYSNLLQEGQEYMEPHQAKRFWQVVRRALPKHRLRHRQLPPLLRADLEDQWQPFFEELECGKPTDFDELRADGELTAAAMTCPIELEDLPGRSKLEDVIRATQPDRATGLDLVPSAVYRAWAPQLALAYHPLLVKEFSWCQEPLQHKGGRMSVIPKCEHAALVKQHRGIMLLPPAAKHVHALVREQVMDTLKPRRFGGQMGGFQHQSVSFGSFAIRAFCQVADSRGHNVGVLFLDISTAFHKLVRELVVGVISDATLEAVLEDLDLSDELRQRLAVRELPSVLQALGARPALIELLKAIHSGTWFTVYGGKLSKTRKGTRPGSPLADAVWHLLMHDAFS